MDDREGEELSWCPSWSNSQWQGWSCGLVHCPAGNATDPIWRVLDSSQGISSWTPLKPQHSNLNPNLLVNQLFSIDFLTPPIPLTIPHRLPAFLESLMHSKTDARFIQDSRKAVWSIPYVSVAFSPIASCDFLLFPKLRGCRYERIEEMKEAVTKVIDTPRQEYFHGPF